MHYEYCKLNNISRPEIYKDFNVARLKNETRKKSLTKDQLKALIAYKPPSEAQKQAKLLFLFSFYARGINLMDMLQLTKENIENNILVYGRQKTGKQMRIKLIKEAQLILDYFKNDSDFLFPYLKKGQVPKYRVRDVNANINRRLKLIGKIIGVYGLSMYYARHSFAELNYKAGVRIEIISQMLGHSNLLVTKTYLKRFSDDEVDEAASTIFDSL
jgi:integrase